MRADFDDTHFAHVGHPSVAIYPAALAVAEAVDASGAEMADAFLIGAEASVRIGVTLGAAHYNRGFQQTSTAGAFGATIAAGRLLRLTRSQMRAALGLCATRASGLKSQFGTMGKPYNAGIAASNGVECATLARVGFTSAEDGLDGPQGFVPTHSDAPAGAEAWAEPPPGRFLSSGVSYKLHACCHGTHAMIEALAEIRNTYGLSPETVSQVSLRTSPRWLCVCDIKAPQTGLEVKFSYVWLAGMVMSGIPTSSERVYTDALAADPALEAFARCVDVAGDDAVGDMQGEGEVRCTDGRVIPFAHDLSAPVAPSVTEERLREKGRGLLGAAADDIWTAVAGIDTLSARALGRHVRGAS